jgi:hypothetical protein
VSLLKVHKIAKREVKVCFVNEPEENYQIILPVHFMFQLIYLLNIGPTRDGAAVIATSSKTKLKILRATRKKAKCRLYS